MAAFDEAFLEFAAQGQSGFDASGDAGAYDASGDLGTTNLSVDTPADSPYITAAGGTTLPWTGTLTGPDGTRHRDRADAARLGLGLPVAGHRQITGESEATAAEANIGRRRRRLQRCSSRLRRTSSSCRARTTSTRCST